MLSISLTILYLIALTSPLPRSSFKQAEEQSQIAQTPLAGNYHLSQMKNSNVGEQNLFDSHEIQQKSNQNRHTLGQSSIRSARILTKSENNFEEEIKQKMVNSSIVKDPALQPLRISQNNFYSFTEGNIQTDDGSRCIFRISKGQVYSILTQGANLRLASNITFNSSFSLVQMHSINNYLIILGSYNNNGNTGYVFAVKLTTNPSSCVVTENFQAFLLKKGSLIGSRGKDNRLIIISEVLKTDYEYFWLLTQEGSTSKTRSNKNQSIEGYQKQYVRSVWSLLLEINLKSYYFQQYFQADHLDLISLQSQNLFLISNFDRDGSNPKFNIQVIHSILQEPFGTMRYSGISANLFGFVPSYSFADQYLNLFRVLTRKNLTGTEFVLYVFRTTSLALLFNKSVSQVGNIHTQIHSCLFIYHNAYLSFPHRIRVYDTFRLSYTDMQNTVFQQNYIHKFKTGASVYLMSFSNLNGKTAIIMYRSLTTGLQVFSTYYLAYSQSQFIDISSKSNFLLNWEYSTIVFSFESTKNNQNQNNLIKKGMCYVYASAYNGCLSSLPFSNCPPSPNNPQSIPPLYKHWNAKLGNYSTAPNEVPDRFTLMTHGGIKYLYSSSSNQMQGRRISYNPPLLNPPIASSILNF